MKFEFKFEIGQEVYILDTSGYYFRIDENTYLNLSKDYPNIETKRKGV